MTKIHELKESKKLYVSDPKEVLPFLAEAPCKFSVCLLICSSDFSSDFLSDLVSALTCAGTKYIALRGDSAEQVHDEIDIFIEDCNDIQNIITTYHENDESDEEVANFVLNAIDTGKGSNVLIVVNEYSANLIDELIKL